ncbi:MAG: Putative phosphatidate cytidylyltransferase [Anaerolinea thermophila]|uniref:Putative phosphatidate cytidylyltransferase n=1 Tax=Anaerolinea thermophila TaxID=167964 RepID=A0A124FMU1_9CHLR|nr:MAG: Putative phosphatidate cytidylyltransferase [Anaerolinea thermophila]
MLNNNLIALAITLVIALLWLRINDYFAHKGWVTRKTSRKIIHIGTGPIFVLCWLLFNSSQFAPLIAAVVPLGITFQFALVGSGVIKDPSAVEAMSRTGNRKEILKGPLFYGLVFVILTIIFWRNSLIGIVALMILCGGDGLADMVGNHVGGYKLPWSPKKTLAGSMMVLIGGFVFAFLMVWVFIGQGYLDLTPGETILPILIIALISAFIESLPLENIDNISMPLVSVIIGMIVF